jgi:glucose/arabinose dehydrogenase
MMRKDLVVLAAVIFILGLGIYIAVSGGEARLQESATVGPTPTIPEPNRRLIPTINIATAKGWPSGEKPTAASGLSVAALATGLNHPRWLYVLPNGDVLVAETNAPADRPEEGKGIKGFVFRMAQKRAGAGVPSPDRLILLRDAGNGQVTNLPRKATLALRNGSCRQ